MVVNSDDDSDEQLIDCRTIFHQYFRKFGNNNTTSRRKKIRTTADDTPNIVLRPTSTISQMVDNTSQWGSTKLGLKQLSPLPPLPVFSTFSNSSSVESLPENGKLISRFHFKIIVTSFYVAFS